MLFLMEEIQPTQLMTKQERREARREEWEAEQKRIARRGLLKKLIAHSVVVMIVATVGYGLFKAATRPKPGESIADLGNEHIESVQAPHAPYNSVPPTSGPHVGGKAVSGVHGEQIPDELQLHNLEDGCVIVHYDPARVSTSTVEELASLVKGYREDVILEPYLEPPLPSPIVLTAWGRIDTLEYFDRERIKLFVKAYRGIDHHKKTIGQP